MKRKLSPKEIKSKEVRMKLYEFVKKHGEYITVKEIETTLGLTHAVAYHHVSVLVTEKFLVSKRTTEGRITTLWVRACGADMPEDYVNLEKVAAPQDTVKETSHIRVVRLLDNPLPKPEESKKKVKIHIGSGMSLFNNY